MTPFYTLALKLFTRTQASQIQKGIEKYPETFNPRSWSPQELLNHALEETVDLTHYLVGLKVLLDDRDEEIKRLKAEISLLHKHLALKRGTPETNASLDSLGIGRYVYTEDWMKLEDVKQQLKPKKPPYFDQDDQH